MLVIRTHQMAALNSIMRQRFMETMKQHIQDTFPDFLPKTTKRRDAANLEEFVQAGIDRSLGYEINDNEDIKKFLDLLVRYGEDFPVRQEHTIFKLIVEDPSIPGSQKMKCIYDNLPTECVTYPSTTGEE